MKRLILTALIISTASCLARTGDVAYEYESLNQKDQIDQMDRSPDTITDKPNSLHDKILNNTGLGKVDIDQQGRGEQNEN
jgi:hypothetical protein